MLLLSCETPISVKLPKSSSTKVIEGWIENGQSPIVVVSNSLDYYSTINVDSIQASVDKDAIVTVTDEYGNTEQLKLGFSFEHIFGLMGAVYSGTTIVGEAGKTYYLRVEDKDGNVYTATTTIPNNTVNIDSLKFTNNNPTDTAALIRVYFTDEASTYDCYRFFVKVNNLDVCYSQISLGTFDDLTFNGKAMNYEMIRSPLSNMVMTAMSEKDREAYYRRYFKKGDVVCVRSTLTDTATLNYWFPLQVDVQVGFVAYMITSTYPTNIKGENVTGIWSGYNARYDTLVFE